MFSFWKKPVPVREMTTSLPRAELIQRSRIAVLDDEAPEMLQDITAQGFSVDHLRSTADERFKLLEIVFYDVLLLDYGGIGQNLGPDEGLDILRHLKRVNPALHINRLYWSDVRCIQSRFLPDVRRCHKEGCRNP